MLKLDDFSPQSPFQPLPDAGANLTCPYCQVRLTVPSNQLGAMIQCPQCGSTFQSSPPLQRAADPGAFQQQAFSNATSAANPFASPIGYGEPVAYAAPNEVQAFASKKIAAGICGILLGGLGVHKFILGLNSSGAIMLAIYLSGFVTGMCLFVPIFASMAMGVIGLIEGIIYLTKSDEEFYQLYAVQKKEWF